MMYNKEELQYGECCCCLKKGDHREVTKQYYLDKRPEIFEVLIKDTFDIVLKYPENTKLICDVCVVELRQAKHFRTLVKSTQQSLSYRVNLQPQFVNVEEPLERELNTESIKCDSDNHMEEDDNCVFECTKEKLNYGAGEMHIKEKNLARTVAEEPSQLHISVSIKRESNDDMEDVPITGHPHKQDNLDPSTASEKLVITQHRMKTLKVLLTRCPTIEQLLSCDSNLQYKQLAAPFYSQCEDNRFVCDIYQCETAYGGALSRYIRTGEKSFSCDICKYRTIRIEDLKVHLRIHTEEKLFYCDFCTYKTSRKEVLKLHLRTHTGERPFSCDICQYKTIYAGDLTRHIRNHTGEKPFSCETCQFKSARKYDLMEHLRTHTREKPYSCNVKFCRFKSKRKRYLNAHLRTHTRE